MMNHKNFDIWQGRNDPEEGQNADRWHHRAVLAGDEALDVQAEDAALIGFCCDEGVERNQGRVGAEEGPRAFRQQLRNIAWHNGAGRLFDLGDLDCVDGDLEAAQEALGGAVAKALGEFCRVLVVGGGHETAVGSFSGLYRHLGEDARIGIINLDAHLDLRTPPAAGPSSGTPFYQIRNMVKPGNFKYICLGVAKESNTKSLFDRADEWGAEYVFDTELKNFEGAWLTKKLENFVSTVDAIYLTIDLDLLPHYQAPGVSAPAIRGVEMQDVERIVQIVTKVASQCRFGMPLADIVELNPQFDPTGVTARSAAFLATELLKGSNETSE
ncbi:formimidoylglutamase [Terasakiella pusilla]|uniref:formimidoylglutamase n=1 Tax=Terasakiella pusilla TaxID=64973 RepID=UPI00048C0319|nr:formimidoylglutamase [Terasakiella pusilla]